MAFESPFAFDAAAARQGKAFFRAAFRFHFWHDFLFAFYGLNYYSDFIFFTFFSGAKVTDNILPSG